MGAARSRVSGADSCNQSSAEALVNTFNELGQTAQAHRENREEVVRGKIGAFFNSK